MYKITIVILFSSFIITAQSGSIDTIKLNNFWKAVERVSQFEKDKIDIDSNSIRAIMLDYYKVQYENPIGYKKSIKEKFDIWEIHNKGKSRSERELKPGVKIGRFKRFLAKKYGAEFVEIIGVPYFIKGKIVGIDMDNYFSEPDDLNYPKTILKIRIDDVLKGKSIFSIGQIIEISILNFWYESFPDFYKVEGDYFFPVKPWNCNDLGCSEYTISFLPNTNFSVFPIKNNIISNVEFFDIEPILNWDNFRANFIKKYVIWEGN